MGIDPESVAKWLALAAPLVAAGGFVLAVVKYSQDRKAERERRFLEANKPFFELQLELYLEAVRTARTIAVSGDASAVAAAKARFAELFWGEMALVEDHEVEQAMISFHNALAPAAPPDRMRTLSLNIAHVCRNSLARSWDAPAWKSDYPAAAP